MKQVAISFSVIITCVLILFQLAKYSHWQASFPFEWWIAIFSLLFLAVGIIISRKFSSTNKSDNPVEDQTAKDETAVDAKQLQKLGLSNREYEVLKLINEGLSNQQIGDRLFISENTIKKHVSNIFIKMDVERRTEAIRKAKDLKILT